MTKEEYIERYMKAMHGRQAGVAMVIALNMKEDTSPKQLRVGVNSAMLEHSALVTLLLDKGIITELEYHKALAELAEQEHTRYEQLLSEHTGSKVVLV